MIGIFDSGVGGYNALYVTKKLLPGEDIIYLADSANAPYGTKSKDEVLKFTEENIKILSARGAEKILIACCTASAIYESFAKDQIKNITKSQAPYNEVFTITNPASAKAAKGKKIAVIATERTVKERAFSKRIKSLNPDAEIFELPRQDLVEAVEKGLRGGNLSALCHKITDEVCRAAVSFGADSLILGCTHFSHLEKDFKQRLPNVRIISPARIGAEILADKIETEYKNGIKRSAVKSGRIIYLQTRGHKTRSEKGILKWENTEEAESTTLSRRSWQ